MDKKLLLLGFVSLLLLCHSSQTTSFSTRRVLRDDHNNNSTAQNKSAPVLKHKNLRHVGNVVVVNNGRVELTFSNPGGDVVGIKFGGIDNLLEPRNGAGNRGYWDITWGEEKNGSVVSHYDRLGGAKFNVVKKDEKHVEISFTRAWNQTGDAYPVNVDKRYIILRGYPGYYTYTILEHPPEAPASILSVIRAAFKLRQEKFNYMAISDDRRRIMPSAQDRTSGQKLAYPEAVLLTNPSDQNLRGEVDDKYQYSMDHHQIKVHGWISSDPDVGFWVITPSHEFLTTGPMKQELTSHVGPTSLAVFMSCHYVGRDLVMSFERGESWKKVFGPIAVYLNKVNPSSSEDHHDVLWEKAKEQAKKESKRWPYSFVNSVDFPSRFRRGRVNGQLLVNDRYMKNTSFAAEHAYVGLAKPGEVGTWQTENKGYQFWVKTDATGNFSIKNVRPGNYNLYAFVPAVIGDYMYGQTITVKSSQSVDLGSIVYHPPRNGPTLWEIGVPDRTAGEFFIPNPLPTLENKLIANKRGNRFRQYGLWDRYTDLYPDRDLVYTVGESNYRHDWFYAHVNRRAENGTYQSTTWQVMFDVENVSRRGSYTLQVAVAAATGTDLQVRLNNVNTYRPLFQTRLMGRDNAIARHGIHGLYRLFTVNVPGYALQEGRNILYLTQARSSGPFGGLMYDYIRFEAPASSSRAF